MKKYLIFTIREFLGLDTDYDTLLSNQENILQSLESLKKVELENVGLATEEQLNDRVEEFNQQVDARIALNRRRVLYAGAGLLGSAALVSLGAPPLGGMIVRTLASAVSPTNVATSVSVEEVIRLRDLWDAGLQRVLEIIKK